MCWCLFLVWWVRLCICLLVLIVVVVRLVKVFRVFRLVLVKCDGLRVFRVSKF